MNWRYSSLALVLLLTACDNHDNSAPQAQAPGTFDSPSSSAAETLALNEPAANAVLPPTTTTTPVAVLPSQVQISAPGDSSPPTETIATTPDVAAEPSAIAEPTTATPPDVPAVATPSTQPAVVATPAMTMDEALALVRAGRSDQLFAAGTARQFGARFAEGGYEDEAFDLLAPQDNVVDDQNTYNTAYNGSIDVALVDETPSVKRNTTTIDSATVHFTAEAGHLVVNGVKADGTPDAKAAMFYTAYRREGLPGQTRPVTFFWNGGPGSSSLPLHLAAWAPWRLKVDAPTIPSAYQNVPPKSFPLLPNTLTLLDRSDLVFVDPPGTGYSTALKPHTNQDFWGTDSDAQVIADFITSYVNKFNRQSSPKYLYGESYGGIRTPIVADLLEVAATSRFNVDPSGNPATVLTGFVLNSPLLNYKSNCDMVTATGANPSPLGSACAGYMPTYFMTADALGFSKARGAASRDTYMAALRAYMASSFVPTLNQHNASTAAWKAYAATPAGVTFLKDLTAKTNTSLPWANNPNLPPDLFQVDLVAGYKMSRYDGRMLLPNSSNYKPDDYPNAALSNQVGTYFPNYLNYKTKSAYNLLNDSVVQLWNWPHRGSTGLFSPSSIADLTEALSYDPKLKLLVLHGYEDLATPGYQTELDLAGAKLNKRVPVKWFEGGHMIYMTEASRTPLKTELSNFYDNATYSLNPPHVATN